MRTSKVLTVSLPPELFDLAEEMAKREGRTRSELFREALRQYAASNARWRQIQSYGRRQAEKFKISEDDIERIVQEYREAGVR